MKRLIVVTGVSMNEAKVEFTLSRAKIIEGHTKGKKAKINTPAGVVDVLSKAGYAIYAIGSCENCLAHIGKLYCNINQYYYKSLDLTLKKDCEILQKDLIELSKEFKIDVVHYGGASETKIELPNNNLFLDPQKSPSSAIAPLVEKSVVSGLNLLQLCKPIFEKQDISRYIMITALTSIRTKRLHTLDAIQKGAAHSFLRSIALDLVKENIFVTEIMPGITDTGFYDNEAVFESILQASKELGYIYSKETFPLLSPQDIGLSVKTVLEFPGHLREISFIPFGQYPHLGA